MKRSSYFILALLAVATGASGQQLGYTNNSNIIFTSGNGVPPQIDAFNFVNNGEFEITLGSGGILTADGISFVSTAFPQYEFSDVTNYINRGTMTCDAGFLFDTEPSGFGLARPAVSFTNSNLGSISSGSFNTFGLGGVIFAGPGFSFSSGSPYIQVSATNIVNRGSIDVGINGFLGISGKTVDLSRGTTHVEGFDDPNIFDSDPSIGLFSLNWGLGLETNFQFEASITNLPYISPLIFGTSSSGLSNLNEIFIGSGAAYANIHVITQSNITYQVVFIGTNLPGVSTDVRFEPAGDFTIPTIRWTAVLNSSSILPASTNILFLQDTFGAFTNFQFETNRLTLSGIPQSQPITYQFFRNFPFFDSLPVGNTPYTPANISVIYTNAFPETNQYSAYTVQISPVTTIPDPNLSFSTISNAPGRVTINASGSLDLTGSTLTGPNYLSINSTNNFIGSAGALISAPYLDINLGCTNTNGLTITNLVLPYLYRSQGTIQMWSARWTNVVNSITNAYHLLMVDPEFTATSQVQVVNFRLSATNKVAKTGGNVVINDVITVIKTCTITAQSVTIATNAPNATSPAGQLNLLSESIIPSTFPGLLYLTNWGVISAININDNIPVLINHGSISASGIALTANDFESTGGGNESTNFFFSGAGNTIFSDFGPINIQAADMALSDGTLGAFESSGDINLNAGSLTISNEVLQASGALTLSINNAVNSTPDGSGSVWPDSWQVNDGFNLLVKPVTGDFLGTTVDDICPSGAQITHTWAGVDLGVTAAGFKNNAAVGNLILDGNGTNCSFFFTGTSTGNAIYVDELDLRDNATNIVTASQGFTALSIDSNMRIYFADAVINGGALDVSQRLDGQYGGRIRWVRDYAGLFSGTNITYPNGVTYTFNRALASSTTIDSNGNGIVNAFDPFPFSVNPVITVSNRTATINWEGIPNSTNFVYYSASLATTNWTLLTKIAQGPVGSQVSVTDPVNANHARYYKVQIVQ